MLCQGVIDIVAKHLRDTLVTPINADVFACVDDSVRSTHAVLSHLRPRAAHATSSRTILMRAILCAAGVR